MDNQNIKESFNAAIIEGIDSTAIATTLNELLNRLNESEITKSTFKDAIDIVLDIKSSTKDNSDYEYLSNYMKENGSKLISALENGISSIELSSYLRNSDTNLKSDVVNLIATLKEMDMRIKAVTEELNKNNKFQKVLVNSNFPEN